MLPIKRYIDSWHTSSCSASETDFETDLPVNLSFLAKTACYITSITYKNTQIYIRMKTPADPVQDNADVATIPQWIYNTISLHILQFD